MAELAACRPACHRPPPQLQRLEQPDGLRRQRRRRLEIDQHLHRQRQLVIEHLVFDLDGDYDDPVLRRGRFRQWRADYRRRPDNGSLSTTGSTTWTTFFGGDGGYAAIDQTDSRYVYGEYVYAAIHRSSDSGVNSDGYICTGITEGGDDCGGTSESNFIAPFILDPNSQSRMLVGAASLWITDNAKATAPTWRAAKSPSSTSGNYISAVAVATGNAANIWVGYNDGSVAKTTNGTATTPTWTAVTIGPARKVMRILIDPSDSNTVYVTFGGYSSGNIRKTTNGGTTWTDISTGLAEAPIRGIARHPTNASWLYVGTEVGIFSSEDGGTTWSTTNDGPGAVSVDELFFIGSTTTLIAATHGRGMFQTSLSSSSTTATPETGWWWYASESGRGFSLEVSGNNLFMAGYLYSTDGTPIWYVSSGSRASNGVYQGTLQQFSGGQTLSGSYQAPSYLGSVGTVTMSFDTTTSGRLTWPGAPFLSRATTSSAAVSRRAHRPECRRRAGGGTPRKAAAVTLSRSRARRCS